MKIRVITTGGEIDYVYNALSGRLAAAHPKISSILGSGRYTGDTELQHVASGDGDNATAEQLRAVTEAVRDSDETKIVITLSLHSLIATGRHLKSAGTADKTIILTGAMVPFSFGVGSDACFNVGAAMAYVKTLSPGVYVAMNGNAYPVDGVVRDPAIGIFKPATA